jgi:hypothetical protein
MIDNKDVWRVGELLLKAHGENSEAVAAQHVDERLAETPGCSPKVAKCPAEGSYQPLLLSSNIRLPLPAAVVNRLTMHLPRILSHRGIRTLGRGHGQFRSPNQPISRPGRIPTG